MLSQCAACKTLCKGTRKARRHHRVTCESLDAGFRDCPVVGCTLSEGAVQQQSGVTRRPRDGFRRRQWVCHSCNTNLAVCSACDMLCRTTRRAASSHRRSCGRRRTARAGALHVESDGDDALQIGAGSSVASAHIYGSSDGDCVSECRSPFSIPDFDDHTVDSLHGDGLLDRASPSALQILQDMNASDAAYDAEVDRNQNRAANERASDLVYVRPQSTAQMHHPFVDMEAGCSDNDDNAYSDNDSSCNVWPTMIPGELCDDEACIGTCYDDINEVGDCAIDIECGNDV